MTSQTQIIDIGILHDLLIASQFVEEKDDDILIEVDDSEFFEDLEFVIDEEDLEDFELVSTKDVYFEMVRQQRLEDIKRGIIPETYINFPNDGEL